MFLYRVGYFSPEDSHYRVFYHQNSFTERQLRDMVEESIATVLQQNELRSPSYDDIYSNVEKVLSEKYGFSPVTYQAEWSCFGWAEILSKISWDGWRDENLDHLTDYLQSQGFTEG